MSKTPLQRAEKLRSKASLWEFLMTLGNWVNWVNWVLQNFHKDRTFLFQKCFLLALFIMSCGALYEHMKLRNDDFALCLVGWCPMI